MSMPIRPGIVRNSVRAQMQLDHSPTRLQGSSTPPVEFTHASFAIHTLQDWPRRPDGSVQMPGSSDGEASAAASRINGAKYAGRRLVWVAVQSWGQLADLLSWVATVVLVPRIPEAGRRKGRISFASATVHLEEQLLSMLTQELESHSTDDAHGPPNCSRPGENFRCRQVPRRDGLRRRIDGFCGDGTRFESMQAAGRHSISILQGSISVLRASVVLPLPSSERTLANFSCADIFARLVDLVRSCGQGPLASPIPSSRPIRRAPRCCCTQSCRFVLPGISPSPPHCI
jgi:hypothetical protein